MSQVKVAATADIHSPRNLELFKSTAHVLRGVDLLIMAGDLIYKGRFEEIDRVVEVVRSYFTGPIYACFGNEEFDEVKDRLVERTRGAIRWLDDEAEVVEVKGVKVGLVGTRGCLDEPTSWQLRNVPGIAELYRRRAEVVEGLLKGLNCDYTLLFSHYAISRETLRGEDPRIWPQMGSAAMERVVREASPTVAIHGHAHRGSVLRAWVGSTLVLNVSLPAAKSIVTFTLPPERPSLKGQATLTAFL